ncbi:MAG: type II secretion system F family protein [Bdellovibrionota bacterium]
MSTYYYRARDRSGNSVDNAIEATDLPDARKMIYNLGLIPIEISDKKKSGLEESIKEFVKELSENVQVSDILVFTRQFQTIYRVGAPLIKGLSLIAMQTQNPYFKSSLEKIIEDLNNGKSIEESLSKYPKIFDTTYVSLVKAGETSGTLDTVLDNICDMISQQSENKEAIKSAMFYPKIVLGVMAIVFLVIVYFVIPKTKQFYDRFEGTLPLATRMVTGVSGFFISYWYLVFGISGGLFYAFKKYAKTSHGEYTIHKLTLKAPVFGPLFSMIETNTFCSIYRLLLDGGVPVVDALELVKGAMKNRLYKDEVDQMIKAVTEGNQISTHLVRSKVFPPLVAGLVEVGEETGSVSPILSNISGYYSVLIKHRLSNLSKMIEPILMAIIFAGVLVLALSVFMPMWQMTKLVKK